MSHIKFSNFVGQKGISLYLAVMTMTILLAIVLGLSVILIGQTKMIKRMGDSVIAFYAADTGMERVLYAIRKENPVYVPSNCSDPCDPCSLSFDCPALNNGAKYTITDKSFSPTAVKIISQGFFLEVNRAIENIWTEGVPSGGSCP